MGAVTGLGGLSLWHDALPDEIRPRPPLPGDRDADVAIVGAGFTGLWTAYYLRRRDPSLRIALVEREFAGFGASGRNGGWCSALFPLTTAALGRAAGREAALAMRGAMNATVDEVLGVIAAESLDVPAQKGGTVMLARNPAQLARAREEVEEARRWGVEEDDLMLLSAEAASERLGATDVLGGTYTPHCAAIDPARLVRALADRVEADGIPIHEQTTATAIRPGAVETDRGVLRAGVVVRATEGYTRDLAGERRRLLPLYSLMIATEPLPGEVWDQIGLRRRETFGDLRHMRIYGQRTADGRLAFGGRGAPYHLGSGVAPGFDRDPGVHDMLARVLVELLPVVRGAEITHRWGGVLGVPRDWCASVGLDRGSGLAWAGGYVGDGVGTTNLAGRTLADLIAGADSELVSLPWVGRRSRRWEPEPLRWLGVNGGMHVMASADRAEARSGRPARRAAAFGRLVGH